MVHVATLAIKCIWGVVALVWLVLAFHTKRTQRVFGGVGRLAIIVVFVGFLISRSVQDASLHRHVWAPSPARSAVVLAFVVVGAAFAIWARLTIGTNWSGMVTLKEDHELMQSGPYHLVRHPIYTGLLLMGVATAVNVDQPIAFAVVAVVIVMFFFKIRLEEKLMTESFPDQYPQYRQKVKAIIPYVL
jgi:protein-S-isoprenylcysteine O-methyltransferase Ste14